MAASTKNTPKSTEKAFPSGRLTKSRKPADIELNEDELKEDDLEKVAGGVLHSPKR